MDIESVGAIMVVSLVGVVVALVILIQQESWK
jgi:hypothetical protein